LCSNWRKMGPGHSLPRRLKRPASDAGSPPPASEDDDPRRRVLAVGRPGGADGRPQAAPGAPDHRNLGVKGHGVGNRGGNRPRHDRLRFGSARTAAGRRQHYDGPTTAGRSGKEAAAGPAFGGRPSGRVSRRAGPRRRGSPGIGLPAHRVTSCRANRRSWPRSFDRSRVCPVTQTRLPWTGAGNARPRGRGSGTQPAVILPRIDPRRGKYPQAA